MLADTLEAIGSGLSAPRRALWGGVSSLLGTETPDSGADLLGRLGMDRDSALTDVLGFGVEALTDPLTYAGGLLGRLGGSAVGGLMARRGASAAAAKKAASGSALARRLEEMAGGGLDRSMIGSGVRAANAPGAIDPFLSGVAPLRQYISPESLASGATRTFKNPEPGLVRTLERLGLGTADDAGLNVNAGLRRNLSHADARGAPGVPPMFAQTKVGRAPFNIVPDATIPAPIGAAASTPGEIDLMRQISQRIGPDIASIHGPPIDPFRAVANQRYQAAKSASLADALRRGLSVSPHQGPFSTAIQGVSLPPGLAARFGPMLAGATAGAGLGQVDRLTSQEPMLQDPGELGVEPAPETPPEEAMLEELLAGGLDSLPPAPDGAKALSPTRQEVASAMFGGSEERRPNPTVAPPPGYQAIIGPDGRPHWVRNVNAANIRTY